MAIPLTARAPVEYWPPSLLARNQAIVAENVARAERSESALDPIKLIVRVPTMYERDAFAATLVRGGVVHYSQQQIRDMMLAGIANLYPDDKFDELVAGMTELWQVGDAAKANLERQRERMQEIMEQQVAEQEQKGKKFKPRSEEDIRKELATIVPDMVMEDSRRARLTAVQQDIMSRYDPLQKTFADLAEQDTRRDWVCIELYVANWWGLEHQPDGNGKGGITRAEAEYLRSAIGAEAFSETADFIFAMHGLDGDEEKNLASLIESMSSPVGSTPSEFSTGSSDAGSSVGETSTSTLATA